MLGGVIFDVLLDEAISAGSMSGAWVGAELARDGFGATAKTRMEFFLFSGWPSQVFNAVICFCAEAARDWNCAVIIAAAGVRRCWIPAKSPKGWSMPAALAAGMAMRLKPMAAASRNEANNLLSMHGT